MRQAGRQSLEITCAHSRRPTCRAREQPLVAACSVPRLGSVLHSYGSGDARIKRFRRSLGQRGVASFSQQRDSFLAGLGNSREVKKICQSSTGLLAHTFCHAKHKLLLSGMLPTYHTWQTWSQPRKPVAAFFVW